MKQYLARLLALLAASLLMFPMAANAVERAAKTISLVVQNGAAAESVASDQALKTYLESKGYTVRLVDHLAPAEAGEASDAIIISASVSANKLVERYRHSAKPILVLEPYALPHMGMAGRRENEDFGTKERERWMWVVNTPHPASGGVRSGLVNLHKRNAAMGFAKPGLGASIIGTLPGEETKATAFTYERGATMDYENIAPARRAFLFVDTVGFAELNEDGLRILDAMLAWVSEVGKR